MKLESLGLKATFGKNVNELDEFCSASIESRIEDLHEAFRDKIYYKGQNSCHP